MTCGQMTSKIDMVKIISKKSMVKNEKMLTTQCEGACYNCNKECNHKYEDERFKKTLQRFLEDNLK